MKPPEAEVIKYRKEYAKVLCPYCGDVHEHTAGGGAFRTGTTYHRAPGCGLYRSPDDRATGYQFTL